MQVGFYFYFLFITVFLPDVIYTGLLLITASELTGLPWLNVVYLLTSVELIMSFDLPQLATSWDPAFSVNKNLHENEMGNVFK